MKIEYSEQFEQATLKQLEAVNHGLLKTALQLRDEARAKFVNNSRNYKISRFKDAIQVGRLKKEAHKIVIHGFGAKDGDKELYKGRFFILGTQYREQKKIKGKTLSNPRNIGRIKSLDTLDNVLKESSLKLQKNIRESLEYARTH